MQRTKPPLLARVGYCGGAVVVVNGEGREISQKCLSQSRDAHPESRSHHVEADQRRQPSTASSRLRPRHLTRELTQRGCLTIVRCLKLEHQPWIPALCLLCTEPGNPRHRLHRISRIPVGYAGTCHSVRGWNTDCHGDGVSLPPLGLH